LILLQCTEQKLPDDNSIWTEKSYPIKRCRACIQAWTKASELP
jgi:hypothetical protein